jgi:hypothetical protein
MANNKVVVRFLADTDQMRKGINQVNGQLSTFGKAVKQLGVAMVATFGAREITQFFQESITSFASLEEAVSKTNVVFGQSADEIASWAKKQSDALALTETAALQYISTLGSILVQSGLTQAEAGELSKQLTTLVADLASFADVPIEQSFNAVKGAIVGEREALKSLGFVITEAEVKTKALNLGLIKQGEELTANAKAQANIAVLMDKTSQAQGDMERTGDSLANQIKKLNAEAKELQLYFGKGLVEGFGDTADVGNDLLSVLKRLQPTMEALGVEVGKQIGEWAELFSALSDLDESVRALSASFGLGEKGIIEYAGYINNAITPVNNLRNGLVGLVDWITKANNAFNRSRGIFPNYGGSGSPVSSVQNEIKAADRAREASTQGWEDYRFAIAGADGALRRMYADYPRNTKAEEDLGRSVGGTTKKLKEQKKAWAEVVVEGIADSLKEAEKVLEDWRGRVVGYLDIGKAFDEANDAGARRDALKVRLDALEADPDATQESIDKLKQEYKEAGDEAGQTWLQRFAQQVSDATNFASLLGDLKSKNLNQTLIDQISGMGAEAGSELASEILNDKTGMIGELNRQVTQVENAGIKLGTQMANQGGASGKDFATNFIYGKKKDGSNGLIPVVKAQSKKVKKEIRKALNTDVEVRVRYVPDFSALDGGSNPRGVVRSVQAYERLNGTKWRDRVR